MLFSLLKHCLDLYITDTALKAILPYLTVLKTISPGCEVRTSLILNLYIYSAQYLHVLQDSKRYMTHPTVQIQSNSQITDIPLTERGSSMSIYQCHRGSLTRHWG